ncbi:MAG: PIN domain-containing protein [Prevotella sp.]|nr:PIN domain-containing protein [Prevotella sp.]MBR6591215.1 PIN domain-containing protein [Prevotella sp.]MBR7172155.1 PIN domain-containing protein [Prevotella sp.]
MKKYLLDTNICIHWLRNKFDIDKKINEVGFENCCISEITVAELKVGMELGQRKGVKHKQDLSSLFSVITIIPISSAIDLYAEEKVRLRLAGTPADDDFDLLIGCSSVAEDLTLVTENINDFKRINNIKIENWVKR